MPTFDDIAEEFAAEQGWDSQPLRQPPPIPQLSAFDAMAEEFVAEEAQRENQEVQKVGGDFARMVAGGMDPMTTAGELGLLRTEAGRNLVRTVMGARARGDAGSPTPQGVLTEEFRQSPAARVGAAALAGVGGLGALASRAIPGVDGAEVTRANQALGAAASQAAGSDFERQALGAVQSGAQYLAAAPLGGPLALGAMALSVANDSYQQAKDAGLSTTAAAEHAIIQGGVEYAFGRLGLAFGRGVLPALTRSSSAMASGLSKAVREVGKDTAWELGEEELTSVFQNLGSKLVEKLNGVDPNTLSTDDWAGLLYDTGVQTLLMSGPLSAAGHAINKTTPQDLAREMWANNPETARKLTTTNQSRGAWAEALGVDRNSLPEQFRSAQSRLDVANALRESMPEEQKQTQDIAGELIAGPVEPENFGSTAKITRKAADGAETVTGARHTSWAKEMLEGSDEWDFVANEGLRAADSGRNVYVIGGDVINQKGLNKFLTQTGADEKALGPMYRIVAEELKRAGAIEPGDRFAAVRKPSGDEWMLVFDKAKAVDEQAFRDAAEVIKQRINEEVLKPAGIPLDLENPRAQNPDPLIPDPANPESVKEYERRKNDYLTSRGTGVRLAVTRPQKGDTVDSIWDRLDLEHQIQKEKGVADVRNRPPETAKNGEDEQRRTPSRIGAKVAGTGEAVSPGTPPAPVPPKAAVRGQAPVAPRTIQELQDQTRASVPGVSEDQIAGLGVLVRGEAAYLGIDPDQHVQQKYAGVMKGKPKNVTALEKKQKAAITFNLPGAEGKALIMALKATNVADMVHELGHVFRTSLKPDDLAVAEKWANEEVVNAKWREKGVPWTGVKNGVWGRDAEEKFATGFERYLAEGWSPNQKVKSVFQQFKDWLTAIYKQIVGSEIDIPISPEIKAVFDKLTVGATTERPKSLVARLKDGTSNLLSPSTTDKGWWRITNFHESGNPFVHTDYKTYEEALKDFYEGPGMNGAVVAEVGGRKPPASPPVTTATPGKRPLANIGETVAQRKFIAEETTKREAPETEGIDAVLNRVQARVIADPEGEKRKLLQAAESGIGWTRDDVLAAREIINTTFDTAKYYNDPAKMDEARRLIEAFSDLGTEQSLAFSARREVAMTPSERIRQNLTDVLLEPSQKLAKEMRQAKKDGNKGKLVELRKQWAAETQKVQDALKAEGFDLDMLFKTTGEEGDKARLKALNTSQTAKGDAWDAAYEYWRCMILSSPTTVARNIVGNTGFAFWNMAVERVVEAAVAGVTRQKGAASFSEFIPLVRAGWKSIGEGLANAKLSWDTETPWWDIQQGGKGVEKYEHSPKAIKGKLGRAIRSFGYRHLTAADAFFKTVIGRAEVAAQAYRIARAKGGDIDAEMTKLVSDPKSEAWRIARDKARELTFTNKLPEPLQRIGAALQATPVLRWLFPFYSTPTNIVLAAGKRLPGIDAYLLYKSLRKGTASKDYSKVPEAAAKTLISTSILMMVAAALAGDDPEKPRITGSAGSRDFQFNKAVKGKPPPFSIRIGGTWVSYAGIEPFATILGSIVDMVHGGKEFVKTGDIELVGRTIDAITGQIESKTFLEGVASAVKIVTAKEGQKLNEGFSQVARMASQFVVPNAAQATIRAARPAVAERGVYGKGADRLAMIGKRALQKTEIGDILFGSEQAVDLWGRPVTKDAPWGDLPVDFMIRLIFPIWIRENKGGFIGDRLLVRWNAAHPEEPYKPQLPDRDYVVKKKGSFGKGETRYMDDAQYREYLTLAGELAARRVTASIHSPEPTEQAMKRLKDILADSREKVKARLLRKWGAKP